MKKITVFAPATIANIGCGFDILGCALETPGDEVTAELCDQPGIHISHIEGAGNQLSLDPKKNTAGVAAERMFKALGIKTGAILSIHKKMPLGSGLGSSAASAAAALFALNHLLGNPVSPMQLVPYGMEAERAACGSAHADNIAPSLLGGFIAIRSYHPLDILQIPCALDLHCAILHPQIHVATHQARAILKEFITLKQLTTQTGNLTGLILGLVEGNKELIQRSIQDVIIEPMRTHLIPGFAKIRKAALEAEALGCSISGSGPSIFAFATDRRHAQILVDAMGNACLEEGIAYDKYVTKINKEGPKLLHGIS